MPHSVAATTTIGRAPGPRRRGSQTNLISGLLETSVPVVLNTSYNLRGEPIVNTPDEAVEDYLNTGMDALVLGRYLLEKEPRDPARARPD